MKSKHLIIASFLAASLALGTTAQADEDYDVPLVLLGGVLLGLSLDAHDHHHYHYNDRYDRYYHHREYRRHESHGWPYRDRHDHDRGRHDRDRHDRDRHDRDRDRHDHHNDGRRH